MKKSVVFLLMLMFVITAFTLPSLAAPAVTIGQHNVAPKIDGVFSSAEWGEKQFTIAQGQPNVTLIPTTDENNNPLPTEPLTADIYLGYDAAHVYICAVATYANHENNNLIGADLWKGDCLQIQISAEPGKARNEMGFGLYVSDTYQRQLYYSWMSPNPNMKLTQNTDYAMKRSGNVTTYEISLPVTQISTTVKELVQNGKIAISMAFHMNKGGFYEYADGIVVADKKDINAAAVATLGASKNLSGGGTQTTSSNSTQSQSGGTSVSSKNNVSGSENSDVASNDGESGADSEISSGTGSQDGQTESKTGESSKNPDDGEEEKSGGNVMLWVIVGVAAVVLVGGGVGFFLIFFKKTPV